MESVCECNEATRDARNWFSAVIESENKLVWTNQVLEILVRMVKGSEPVDFRKVVQHSHLSQQVRPR